MNFIKNCVINHMFRYEMGQNIKLMHGKDSFTVWVGLSTDDVYPSLFFYHDLQ